MEIGRFSARRTVGETRFDMDATTPLIAFETLPSSRRRTPCPDRAQPRGVIGPSVLRGAEVFKKTPCVADLKPAGRDVAKDMREAGGMSSHGPSNVILTDEKPAARQTEWPSRATNPASGTLWKYAQQTGAADYGAAIQLGGAHEKQCYADI
jgi:hypothetical protein